MSSNIYFLSPQNYKKNMKLFEQYSPNFPKLEKEILKLINYLRISPDKYLREFNNYFPKSFIYEIIKEFNKLDKKLFPFKNKKEIDQAGKDYLDFLIKNNIDKSYFKFNNINKTCFNLKERLSKYGERNGKIFESVIINSSNGEDIVNKLIKDEKARKMILSPNMKYIGITCGFLSNFGSICTIIDIVQDFIAYKDINNFTKDNSIQIINSIEIDETENNCETKKINKNLEFCEINDYINNDNSSKTFINKNSNILNSSNENIENDKDNDYFYNDEKIKKESEWNNTIFNILERKNNLNSSISRNNHENIFNNKILEKSKLISPLATYKSDAHLVLNNNNCIYKKNLSSLKRKNSNINYNSNLNNKFAKTYKNFFGLSNNNINKNDLNNTYNNKKYNIAIVKSNSDNKINKKEAKLKNEKDNYCTERINEKKKLDIFKLVNKFKNNLEKDEENNIKHNIKKIEIQNIGKEEAKNNDKNYIEINKNENIELNSYIYPKEKKNNILYNRTYNFFTNSKQNLNVNNTKDYILLYQKDQFDNPSNIFQSKTQKMFFPKTDENNLFHQKDNILNKKLKINLKSLSNNNIKNKNEERELKEKNKNKFYFKNISFKLDKTSSYNSEETIKQSEKYENKENIDNNNCENENENLYHIKNKKEIKKLIRLYNKQRIEQKNRFNCITNINNENNININFSSNKKNANNSSTKKNTATFFCSQHKEKGTEEKKIKIYKKHILNGSNSYNKNLAKTDTYFNNSYNIIKTQKNFSPKNLKTEICFDKNENKNKSCKNILMTDKNYYDDSEKKRIYSYITNRSKKLNKNSNENILREINYKNLEKKKFLSNIKIDEIEDNIIKTPQNQIKNNYNDNLETNVNSDYNNENINDCIEEILKLNIYKNKEINKKFKKNSSNEKNYIYKRDKIMPENNNFNYYKKTLKKNLNIKIEIHDGNYSTKDYGKINHILSNNSKKKYIIPYTKK